MINKFLISSLNFAPGKPDQPLVISPNKTNIQTFQMPSGAIQTATKNSYLGTPVYSGLEIPTQSYEDVDGTIKDIGGIRIDSCIIAVTQKKNIVETPIQGHDGTVKQYISLGDYEIQISGQIIGSSTDIGGGNFSVADEGNTSPDDELQKFIIAVEAPVAIEIQSEFLALFNVTTVVVTDYDVSEKEGFLNQYIFMLKLKSDTPIELQ